MPKRKFEPQVFTVSDGELVLFLHTAEEGGFVVTSPLHEELITEAQTLEEAFTMAHDALEALADARAKRNADRKKKSKPRRRETAAA